MYACLTCTCSHMLIRQQICKCINYASLHCTKYDPALPTESYVPLGCFISTQCLRESLPSSEYIINYKNSPRVTNIPDVLQPSLILWRIPECVLELNVNMKTRYRNISLFLERVLGISLRNKETRTDAKQKTPVFWTVNHRTWSTQSTSSVCA